MSLKEKLDAIRNGAESQIPPSLLELMHRATPELEDSQAPQRAIKVGALLPAFALHNQRGDEVRS